MGINHKLLREATSSMKLEKVGGTEIATSPILTLKHMQGPFAFLVLGLLASLLSFLGEIGYKLELIFT